MGRRPLSLRMLRKSLDWNFRPGRNANVRLTSRRLVQQSVLAAGRLMYPHPPRVVAEYKSVSANIPRSRRLTPAAAAKVVAHVQNRLSAALQALRKADHCPTR